MIIIWGMVRTIAILVSAILFVFGCIQGVEYDRLSAVIIFVFMAIFMGIAYGADKEINNED